MLGGIMRYFRLLALLAAGLCFTAPVSAEVVVNDPWVRAPVAGQKTAGAYMQFTSAKTAFLIGATSPAAKSVEVHEMSMDGGVMKMRPLTRLELPAGKPVELKPGGYHLMLIDLVQPLHKGDSVPITFSIETAGQREAVQVKAIVKEANTMGEHHHESK
jgi:periplasmic copper chaperone A